MADPSRGQASFWTQSNALLRKNLTYQKRNWCTNCLLIMLPSLFCLMLLMLETQLDSSQPQEEECEKPLPNGMVGQTTGCPIPRPPKWPPLLQVPSPDFRAVRDDNIGVAPFTGLPDASCKRKGSCPVTLLITGNNHTLGESGNLFPNSFSTNYSSTFKDSLAYIVLGTESTLDSSIFLDYAFSMELPIYSVQRQCLTYSSFSVPISTNMEIEVRCVQGLHLWRNTSSAVNNERYQGYPGGNSKGRINEILAAYDFLNTSGDSFNVGIWFNSTYKEGGFSEDLSNLLRVPRSINLVSNAYLQFLKGPGTKIVLDFVKEMPKPKTQNVKDFSYGISTVLFVWACLLLFPKLRIMMKMHGLGDGPYWMISYAYFLFLSSAYMACFVLFGSAIGLNFFRRNDYVIQFLFYFIYTNMQISMAFLASPLFSDVKTATVVAYIFVFGSGLLGQFLFEALITDVSFPKHWIVALEIFPGFSLFRGLYEFSEYARMANLVGTGMQWRDLSDDMNGMKEVFAIMLVDWLVFLVLAFYIDLARENPLLFTKNLLKKRPKLSLRRPSLEMQVMDKPDVIQEREKVEEYLVEPGTSHYSIICDDLKKIYPGRDGNPSKFAVKGVSLAVRRGECFGILGPNGAGKTSFISMMIGLTRPTSGTAFVQGKDIKTQMDEIYTSMGVCPQHDLLWETLTGREHLLFYGRLKNLKGSALKQAVEDSLNSVNLNYDGVPDKQARSGGMKRRLSVAISLIGDPKVVYMDEPSTGLDPYSKNSLWNIIKHAKIGRAIILTTHSMEEAEVLCDRLGIFVDGRLQCIGNSKELKVRYGGSFVFTMTTSSEHEKEVENLVTSLSPNASKIYHISGTQKFEIPKREVRIADIYQAVENAKRRFTVSAWGLADSTLEDVFVKVAGESETFNM